MTYMYANLRREEDGNGWRPDLPEDAGFLLLAEPRFGPAAEPAWALFDVSLPDDVEAPADALPLEATADLIDSGEAYPPALALARDEVARRFPDGTPDRQTFEAYYAGRLTHHLDGQRRSGFLLARARDKQIGYMHPGCYYWIVRYDPARGLVGWVSSDYCVYTDAATCFDVSAEDLKPLAQ